ncbi:MAG: hypothetical protein M5U26_08520 [Planctomycetota bacterium]|nr:hypothetical protein [Planctomycetota bacterium]
MRFGSPHASGFGSPDNHLLYAVYDRAPDDSFVNVRLRARDGWGDAWFHVYKNAEKALTLWVPEGAEGLGILRAGWGEERIDILPLRVGHAPLYGYSDEKVARVYEAVENTKATVAFDFVPETIQPDAEDDGGFTSGWDLAGLVQGENCKVVNNFPARGRLRCEITLAGLDVTVTLKQGNRIVAQGTATDPEAGTFPVTLAAQNDSGLSGEVTLGTGVDARAFNLYVRWPLAMRIKRGAADPPTVVVATMPFRGKNSVRWTEPADLAAGTYYYRVQPLSDTDDAGTESASDPVTIPAPPEPPSELAFESGDATGFDVAFTPSPTAGATYRAYMSQTIGQPLNLNDIKATAIAGAESITLPAVTGSPGKVYVLIRAVAGGVEERNLELLAVEFDSGGAFVPPRPNPARIDARRISIEAGLTAHVPVVYDVAAEFAEPVTAQLFTRTPGAAYDYGSPDDEQALGEAAGGLRSAALSYEFASAGWYYVAARAVLADGTLSPVEDVSEVLVYVSDADMAAAANFDAALSRG